MPANPSNPRKRIVTSDLLAPNGPTFSIYSPDAGPDGKQPVADTYTLDLDAVFTGEHRDRMLALFTSIGFAFTASNAYGRFEDDDRDPAKVCAVFDRLAQSIKDGTFTPGRNLGEREPDDIVLAIAEATGQPVADIQDKVDNELVMDPDTGQPRKDAKGNTSRVFTKRTLDAIAKDPKVAPIMARLAAERAKRMADEAKALVKKGGTTGGLGLFSNAQAGESPADAAK